MPPNPVEPAPTPWNFAGALDAAGEDDLIAVGADLEPGTILAAYRIGVFPMGVGGEPPRMGWWSPQRRGVLLPGDLHISRTLRRSARRFLVSIDQAFDPVLDACAHSGRRGDWISADIADAYRTLHGLGWAHSVEVWDEQGDLVGGLYGVALGGLFAGESMFHRATDASKVALVGLVDVLAATGDYLIDVQWRTQHLASLGIIEIDRDDYRTRLPVALAATATDWGFWSAHRWTPGEWG